MSGFLLNSYVLNSGPPPSSLSIIRTWAKDSTLNGLVTDFGTQIASSATTFKGSSVTGFNDYSGASIVFDPTTMIGPNIVNIVWSNNQTTATNNLVTNIINNGGKVIVMVFAAIGYAVNTYNITEQSGLTSPYQLLSSTGQRTLPTTTLSIQNQLWLGTSVSQSFNATSYYSSSPTSTLLQPLAEIFLRDESGNPYGAVYKNAGTNIAQILIWPGSVYGYSGTFNSSSIVVPLLARLALYMCQ